MSSTDQPATAESTPESDLASPPINAERLLQLITTEYESLPRQLKRIASYMSQQSDRIMVDRYPVSKANLRRKLLRDLRLMWSQALTIALGAVAQAGDALAHVLRDCRCLGFARVGQYGDEAKFLAGGHSLIPLMKLRLAQPSMLIDIGRITDLS